MAKKGSEWQPRWGKDLVIQCAIVLKTARLHEAGNEALISPMERLTETIGCLLRADGSFTLKLRGDFLFVDDNKVKTDIEDLQACLFLMEEMKKREVGAVSFEGPIPPDEIKRFFYVFNGIDPQAPSPYDALMDQLSFERVTHIQPERWVEAEDDGISRIAADSREMSKRIYFKTLMVASEVMESSKLQSVTGIKKAKRMVQSMVDMVLREESTLVGLTTLKAYDEYTYNHSVNVCILSLTVGQRLGYSKRSLCELGMATLFHDIGKIDIPSEILNKPSEFTPEEWKIMRKHPVHGVKTLLRMKGLHEQSVRMMMVAFEHHLNYDQSGYPRLMSPRKISLFGRIASIADCYDALTSARVYNRKPQVPDRALSYMLQKSGTAFDPILMKVFVNAVGIYPVGTLVQLTTGELGIVMMTNPNPGKVNLPKVKVVADWAGNETDGDLLDLSDDKRRISKTLDHRKYGVDVSRYFL